MQSLPIGHPDLKAAKVQEEPQYPFQFFSPQCPDKDNFSSRFFLNDQKPNRIYVQFAKPLVQQKFFSFTKVRFAIRKIENSWWDLNSTHNAPVFLSPLYLGAFLKQLQVEGYSIFVIRGEYPRPMQDGGLIPPLSMNLMFQV